METSAFQILVHNVSHSDLVLSVNDNSLSLPSCKIKARPKFSHFREITEKIFEVVKSEAHIPLAMHECYSRMHPESHLNLSGMDEDGETRVPFSDVCAVGFNLHSQPVKLPDVSSLRYRRDDSQLLHHADGGCLVDAAYFPLVAALVPKWMGDALQAASAMAPNTATRFIVILISGRGSPSDSNSVDARVIDNSTRFTGRLLARFIQRLFPAIEIIHVHSRTNLFRYDENILFVKHKLLPLIDKIRDNVAAAVGAKWRDLMKVSLSFADGSSARVSAINASLCHYRLFLFTFLFLFVNFFFFFFFFYHFQTNIHAFLATKDILVREQGKSNESTQCNYFLILCIFRSVKMTSNATPSKKSQLNQPWLDLPPCPTPMSAWLSMRCSNSLPSSMQFAVRRTKPMTWPTSGCARQRSRS
jgi:hypothetical protein